MDDRVISGAIVLAVLVLLLALMYAGWRSRQRRQSGIPRPQGLPELTGRELIRAEAFYVASTMTDEPLNRIAVAGLGYRARARVQVFESGISLGIAGEPDAFIPRSDLVAVERATWTIDRVVEPGGLVRIVWRLGNTTIDSYLRVPEPTDPSALIGAIESIITAPTGARNEEQ